MLSLLRHVGRRSATAVRPVLAVNYSAQSSPSEEWSPLEVVLNVEAEKQKQEPPKAFAAIATARINAPAPYFSRRAAVGPPPVIARYNDVFRQFDIDPVSQAMNPEVLSHYMSEMGKIYGRNVTGLTSRSQRRISKAIRRAKMMGIIPILSKTQGLFDSSK
ncbi:hypothetical protein DXG03_000276 [Asterophora parasitica]|uniref:Small ribosomal subunit protein bS18m n=1 Tax=Asterophora parasitica TaxID=117018 RepID=A0A9P7GL15_9AGAR|nr:hypothetical protein DXG03_000276 [Asterophora parasitica]